MQRPRYDSVPDAVDFVRAIMRALKLPEDATQRQMIDAVPELRHGQAKLSRWLRGLTQPDYQATVAMLLAADWLTDEARAALGLPSRIEGAVEASTEAAERAADVERRARDDQGRHASGQ